MKMVLFSSLLMLAAALCIPLVFSVAQEPPEPAETDDAAEIVTVSPLLGDLYDDSISFTVLEDGKAVEHTISDYLVGVLAGEMPASFELDALKAQAVAARTYILYNTEHENDNHPQADVCNDSTCCKAYVSEAGMREKWGAEYDECLEKLTLAVRETDGEYLSYSGKAIQAVFHSSSAGMTEDSGSLWSPLAYLVSVESPESAETVPNYITNVEIAASEFSSAITRLYPSANLSGDASGWVTGTQVNSSGRISGITIGGQYVSGSELRSAFELRSTAFELEYADGVFTFTVTGYGHGVGMSQYGANVMAQDGSTYEEILSHYYPDTEIVLTIQL